MRPGKGKAGYFSNNDILEQAEEALRILREFYPGYEHVLIYDNASTHLKRGDGALSAHKMPRERQKQGRTGGLKLQNAIQFWGRSFIRWMENLKKSRFTWLMH